MSILYLTAQEREFYEALSEDLRETWGGDVQEEPGSAYETEEQLAIRADMFSSAAHPEASAFLEKVIAAVQEGDELRDLSFFEDFPQDLLPDLLFTMGATGISAVIESALQVASAPEDLDGIAAFSEARHRILSLNAVPSPSLS